MGSYAESGSESRSMSDREAGMATLQYVLATAFAMVLLVLSCNAMFGLYVRAAVRDALDEGVRSAVPLGAPPEACEARIGSAVRELVRGPFVDGVRTECVVVDGVAAASARVRIPSFVPLLFGGWTFTVQARASVEAP